MDDFLHNLRSGKLKQPERNHRQYGDQQYKGGPRRNTNVMDRRKRESDNRESSERLNIIKELLDNVAKSQKRLAEAYEARIVVEERKAQALEILAKSLCRMFNPQATDGTGMFNSVAAPITLKPESDENSAVKPSEEFLETLQPFEAEPVFAPADQGEVASAAVSAAMTAPDPVSAPATNEKLSDIDRQTIVAQIREMRNAGESWEHIARHIADQGYPTISGKGSWRGIMVKNLYEKSSI